MRADRPGRAPALDRQASHRRRLSGAGRCRPADTSRRGNARNLGEAPDSERIDAVIFVSPSGVRTLCALSTAWPRPEQVTGLASERWADE